MKRIFRAPELYLFFVLVCCVLTAIFSNPKVSDAEFSFEGAVSSVELPLSQRIPPHRAFGVSMNVDRGIFSKFSMRIIPDDCLESLSVGGENVRIDTLPGRCDYSKGVELSPEMLPEMAPGKIPVQMRLRNHGGPGGVSVEVVPAGFAWRLFQILFTLDFLLLVAAILRRFHMPGGCILLVLFSTLLHIGYALETPYTARAYDVDGHMAYIRHVADNREIPDADACWTCYHPPVYYVATAPVWKVAEIFHFPQPRAVQWAMVVLSVVTVACGVFSLRLSLRGPAFAVAAILWAFWPELVLTAPRIGNDQLFFAVHGICLLTALLYVVERKSWSLVVGAIAAAVAYGTKSTGIVTFAIWLTGFFLGYFPRERWLPKVGEWLGLCIAGVLGIFVLIWTLGGDALIGNASGLNGALKVGAGPANFLYFDLPGFLTTTYTSAWSDEGGRQFFWNYLMKTSLFGEFKIREDAVGEWLAGLMNLSFVFLLFFAVVGFWKKRMDKIALLLLVQGFLFIAAMISLRLEVPYACSTDFRYITPVVLSFVPFVGWGIFKECASVKWRVFGLFVTAVFVGATCILYLSL